MASPTGGESQSLSMGSSGQEKSLPVGGTRRIGLTSAQCFALEGPPVHIAPWSIHTFSKRTLSAASGANPSGIRGLPPSPRIRLISRLSAPLPATLAQPEYPPFNNASLESTRRLPSRFPAPWHWITHSLR